MKPLSILTHIKNNIKRLIPTIITLGLEFAALTFMVSIGIGQIYAVNHNGGTLAEKTVWVQMKENLNKDETRKLMNEIGNIEGVNKVVEGTVGDSVAMLPIMYSSMAYFNVHGDDDVESILNEFKCKLIQGELPKNSEDILLTKEAMNALKVEVGDWVGEDYNSEFYFGGNFKVVGVTEGKYPLYLTKANEKKDNKGLIIVTEEGKAKDVLEKVKSINEKVNAAGGYERYKDFITDMFTMLKRLGFLAIGVFSIGILITVINLSKSIISNFSNEYSILRAIGYNVKFIRGRIGKQLLVLLMGASFVGIIGGVIVNVIFDKLYCVPKGIAYEEFNIYLVIIPIMVALGLFVLTNLIIGKRIKKIDFIGDMDM